MKLSKQKIKSLVFASCFTGIDYIIKYNNNSLTKYFSNNNTKMVVYYVVLFVVSFIIYEIVNKKMQKFNQGR